LGTVWIKKKLPKAVRVFFGKKKQKRPEEKFFPSAEERRRRIWQIWI